MSMKKKGIYKGAVAFMALCMSCGSIMPLSSTYVQAQENVAENEQNGIVSLSQNENQYTFGNEYITRTFSLTNGKLKTEKITNYRTGQTPKVLTPASSEEFVIKTLPKEIEGKSKVNVNDVVGTGEGKISNLTDQVLSSDVPSNFWASKDANNYVDGSELSIEIAIGSKEEVKKFKYVPRFDNSARWNCTGRVEEAQLFYFDDESNSWKQIGSTYKMNVEGETVIEFEKPISTSKIKFVATKTYHWQNGTNGQPDNRNKVMSASEIDLLGDENNSLLDRTRKEEAQILKSSDLEVDGEPTLTESNGVKILTFAFKPKEVSGVDYTIKEVITFKDGDSFMRKHLEISVPEAEANNVKIDYIDLENMDFAEEDASVNGKLGDKTQNYWTIPELKDNPDMANMKGDYLELGQPYYVGAMYWGCEFPQSENKIRLNNQTNKQNGFIRYHYGKSLAIDTQFTEYNNYNGANGQAGKMVTWDSVVGAARSTDYLVVQSDFYEYIETIATPTEFR